MSEPWNLTEAQRLQFREAHAAAKVQPEVTDDADGDEPEDEIVRAKGVMDDATTLAEAAQKVRAFADELQRLHDEGYVLDGPVADDYGFYSKP